MKKPLAILLVVVMVLSLCACKKAAPETSTPTTGDSTYTTESSSDSTEESTEGTEGTDGTDETSETPNTNTNTNTNTNAACTHEWKAATCTAPKTCAKCNATEGKAAGHSWKDATCQAPKTCTKCNATEGSAAGHNWKAATCTAPKTCTKCNATEGDVVHTFNDGACSSCFIIDPTQDFSKELWQAYVLLPGDSELGAELNRFMLQVDFGYDGTFSCKEFFEKNPHGNEVYDEEFYEGKTYYNYTFSAAMGGFQYSLLSNGIVQVDFVYGNGTVIGLKRNSEEEYVVATSTNPDYLPVGTVFTCG